MTTKEHLSARLAPYVAKRDFAKTSEPVGGGARHSDGHRFVVQRHRARRLHYDFRLEIEGVLVSWSVPKGPTLDPKVRRLAVHVEDHPIEYLDFEGVIPKGEYGGGDVIVWDRGTWSPSREGDDTLAAVSNGEVHVDLRGDKLAGRFVLVRTSAESGGKEQWLLLHKSDEHAVPGWEPEEHPRSVKSGRTNDEVAQAPPAEWHSDRPAARAEEVLAPRHNPSEWESPTPRELAALDELDEKGTWSFQHHRLALTNLDKVLFPDRDGGEPITKRELVAYHAAIAPAMLPYLVDRPVNLHRFPNGVERKGFWDKSAPSSAPGWLEKWHYKDAQPGKTEWYSVIDSPASLAWMANHAALELHPWTSTKARPREPSWALIDIDPGERTTFDDVRLIATLYRAALDHVGLASGAKVSGQTGIQIWIPVRTGYTFDETRDWVERLSRAVGDRVPELVSWAWRTKEREGRARLDFTQNAINKTLVAPFSARPAPGAPVSVPIRWDEIDDPDLRPDGWTIRTVLERLATRGDPLASLVGLEQDLPTL